MLNSYTIIDQRLCLSDEPLPANAVWIDMLSPTQDEEKKVEQLCGIEIPTAEEMQEIEISSRLYHDDGSAFMTAWVLAHGDDGNVVNSPITFILTGQRMITLRYHQPRFFKTFAARGQKSFVAGGTADHVLVALLEASVDRLADIIETIAHEMDGLSHGVFGASSGQGARTVDYREKLVELGKQGDLLSDVRESLASLDRLFGYLGLVAAERKVDKDMRARIKTLSRDARSLIDHMSFVSQKVSFLLDATLGLINIDQNQIIKILSVAAVVFLPPTLIASMYGMNFQFMPELASPYGYPLILGAMGLSAVLPYLYFKLKGWL